MGSSSENNYCIIWDVEHSCWLRYTTGQAVNVICLASGYKLYAGQYNGKIYEKLKASTYSDASIDSPYAYNGYWNTPQINLQNNFSAKQIRFINILHKSQTAGTLWYNYGYDFSMENTGYINTAIVGGKWNVDAWDTTFMWGGQSDRIINVPIFGRGNIFQFKFYNNIVDQQFFLKSMTILMKEQGIKEFSAK